jgi:hypothetical protein
MGRWNKKLIYWYLRGLNRLCGFVYHGSLRRDIFAVFFGLDLALLELGVMYFNSHDVIVCADKQ